MRFTSDLEMPAGPAKGFHQRIVLPGANPTGVSLHDYGVQATIDPACGSSQVGWNEASLKEPGDGQGEITHLGGKYPLAIAVSVGGPLFRAALIPLGTDGGGNLCLQKALEATAHDLRDQGTGGGTLQELSQLRGGRMVVGHGVWLGLLVVLQPGTQTGPPLAKTEV
jgi:hypothetical protein